MIKYFLNIKFAKKYNEKVQNFCKTASFSIINKIFEDIN